MLKKRKLGRTGLEVSELALGGLFIGSFGTDAASAQEVIRRAIELGINYIDTAPGYTGSEQVIGDALGKIDEPCILSTKMGYKPEPFEPRNAEFLRRALADSLKRLQRDAVDILMIHEPDRVEAMDWWEDAESATGPVMDILSEALETGQARYTGLGGSTVYEMAHIVDTGKFDVLITAFNYDLLWREAGLYLLPSALENRMGIVCGSPLHQGAFARPYLREVKGPSRWLSTPRQKQFLALYDFVSDCGLSLPELALRFLLSDHAVSTVLTGARSVEELENNVAAAEKGPLPEEMLEELNTIADMVPFRPMLEPLGLPFEG